MSEQWSREAPENAVQPQAPDEAKIDEHNQKKDEFKSYSLDLLVMLED